MNCQNFKTIGCPLGRGHKGHCEIKRYPVSAELGALADDLMQSVAIFKAALAAFDDEHGDTIRRAVRAREQHERGTDRLMRDLRVMQHFTASDA